jgi:secondary thiamine-phosphate synthase enzyme
MRQAQGTLAIDTRGKGLTDISGEVRDWLAKQGLANGLLTLFCRHTSASLLIQENAAPAARRDLEAFFERIAPEDPALYEHDDEGPDDMPAHLRAALTQTQLSIPVSDGAPALGTWQGIFLFEHRRAPHRRQVVLHLMGE